MSRKQSKIQTKSYIHLAPNGEAKICMDNLNNVQKDYLGSHLQIVFLNSLHVGKVQFWTDDMPPIKDAFSDVLLQLR